MSNYRYFNLDDTNKKIFYNYCWKYGCENDESFLPVDEDFEIKSYRPGIIVVDERNRIQGAANLMLDDAYLNSGKARFAIYHSINNSPEIMEGMLSLLSNKAREKGVSSIFLQIPKTKIEQIKTMENLGFFATRKTLQLSRPKMSVRKFILPNSFDWVNLNIKRDAEVWCDIINLCYKNRPEHIPYTPAMLKEDFAMDDTFEGCGAILIDGKVPVGLYYTSLVGMKELWIGHLCILPNYRGLGIGKNLLRKCIMIGNDIGVECALSLDSENEKGLGMCISEDFDLVEEYIKYEIKI